MSEKTIEEFIEEIYGCAHPGHALWIHVKQLLDRIDEVKAERDAAYRAVNWMQNHPICANGPDDVRAVIEAARKLEGS